MNNEEQKLSALTNQLVTIILGGIEYQARRATLYDLGLMIKKRKQLLDSGDSANIDMDVTFYVLYELMKDYNPTVLNPEDLAKSIPFENYKDVMTALTTVGFKMPQLQTSPAATETVTGA